MTDVIVPPALSVRALAKAFGDHRVLKDLDLDVAAGSLTAVLGPSGCGKTTLLRLIAGFERADLGTITLAGLDVSGPGVHVSPEHRRVGFVAQEGALFPHLSVSANVGFGLTRTARRAGRVEQMLELVGLSELGDRHPHELSGGEQQRIALARALAPEPELIVLDEPFNALDAGLRTGVRTQLRAALARAGATALLVTHDQEEALSLADQVAVMRDGRIAQCADPQTLYNDPVDIELARFLGQAIVLPASVEGKIANCTLGALPVRPSAPDADADGPATVMIRPEQVAWHPAAPELSDEAARVLAVTYYGHDATLRLSMGSPHGPAEILARTPGHRAPQVGDRVTLTVEGSVVAYPR
jgi:iron(III) transport system ATP-binding protein